MTCRERLSIEKPKCVGEEYLGGCHQCPHDYGYLDQPDFCDFENCRKCWDREIPETEDAAVKADDKGDEERKTEMTTEEKRRKLDGFCDKHELCDERCPLYVPKLKCGRGEHFNVEIGRMSDADIDLAYSIAFPDTDTTPHILDSGERRQFDTGAVRDIQEGKGRCDLLPLDVIARVYGAKTMHFGRSQVFDAIAEYVRTGDATLLYNALGHFMLDDMPFCDRNWSTMFLEVAKHFEEGCKKYGENNWQKGIPTRCYIDSAVRHYLKWARGDKDEPHDRAFVWNILCCIWTCIHKPELNDYAKKDGADHEESHD